MSKSDGQFLAELLVVGFSAYAGAAQAQREQRTDNVARRIEQQRRVRELEVLGKEFGLLLATVKSSWGSEAKRLVRKVIVDADRGITANQLHQLLDSLSWDSDRSDLCRMLRGRITNPHKLDLESHFSSSWRARDAARDILR